MSAEKLEKTSTAESTAPSTGETDVGAHARQHVIQVSESCAEAAAKAFQAALEEQSKLLEAVATLRSAALRYSEVTFGELPKRRSNQANSDTNPNAEASNAQETNPGDR